MLKPETLYPIENVTKNVVFLKNVITNPLIEVGDYTYYDGRGKSEDFEKENVLFCLTCRLKIGKFCQLAYGTTFIMSDANHDMQGFSTYPFFIFGKNNETCPEWDVRISEEHKGDTTVGNDVWFGRECTLMPGVTISDGAIIGARAVVTKDVPPYTIVAGNPAKVVKQRFSGEMIEKLLKIQWWNWDYNRISNNLKHILGTQIEELENITNIFGG